MAFRSRCLLDLCHGFIGKRKLLISRGGKSTRKYQWTFFLMSDRPQLIQSVDLRLHDGPRPRDSRFVRLPTEPPFRLRKVSKRPFTISVMITLREGWEWISRGRMSNGRKDRLQLEWNLDFDGHGSQVLRSFEIRRHQGLDEILQSVRNLFDVEEDIGPASLGSGP